MSERRPAEDRFAEEGSHTSRTRAIRIWDDARYAHKYGFLEVVREVRYALDGPQ